MVYLHDQGRPSSRRGGLTKNVNEEVKAIKDLQKDHSGNCHNKILMIYQDT